MISMTMILPLKFSTFHFVCIEVTAFLTEDHREIKEEWNQGNWSREIG